MGVLGKDSGIDNITGHGLEGVRVYVGVRADGLYYNQYGQQASTPADGITWTITVID